MDQTGDADIAAIHNLEHFNAQWYIGQYPDVKMLGMDPEEHYLWIGKRLGRRGSATDKCVNSVVEQSISDRILCPLMPVNQRDYWIPQGLRDYLLEMHQEAAIPQITCLMDLVTAYSVDGIFDTSPEFLPLLKWVRDLARVRSVSDVPDVSIIIPVYNNLVLTLTAIASILGNTAQYSYEILVADDCSTDGTAEATSGIGGCIKHIRNPSNLGFLSNCNRAAQMAHGKYVVMLNNDVITLPGWLDNLITPFERNSGVGMTGSKLLNNDGTLQEAGGIFWEDGSAWNFGRNQDPRLPEFNYAKEVDYCSGASIAFPTEIWRRLGGFDPHFTPAYCEDSDIAFRVRQMGLKVLYQPHSEIIHHEGMSHGRDTSSGLKAYQVANTDKLVERWKDVLKRDHFPNGKEIFWARDRSRMKPHILIVDHYVPQWDRDAGSRTMYDCIRFFIERGFHVTLWPDNLHCDRPYVIPLQELGVEVLYGPALAGKFAEWWRENGRFFQYAFIWRSHIAINYVEAIRKHASCPVLYYGVDVPWMRMLQAYDVTGNEDLKIEAEAQKLSEDEICQKSDYILYPAREECDYARSHFPHARGIIEMPAWLYDDQILEKSEMAVVAIATKFSHRIIFVGGFAHAPNGDGILWFLREIFPLIRQKDPSCSLIIAGSDIPDDIQALACESIEIRGWVSDEELAELYGSSGCTIAPLRFGAGVKGKVIGAFASGLPVISTSVGVQGVADPHDIAFVADTATEFADAVVLCLKDRLLAQRKAQAALTFIRDHYSKSAMANVLSGAIPEIRM